MRNYFPWAGVEMYLLQSEEREKTLQLRSSSQQQGIACACHPGINHHTMKSPYNLSESTSIRPSSIFLTYPALNSKYFEVRRPMVLCKWCVLLSLEWGYLSHAPPTPSDTPLIIIMALNISPRKHHYHPGWEKGNTAPAASQYQEWKMVALPWKIPSLLILKENQLLWQHQEILPVKEEQSSHHIRPDCGSPRLTRRATSFCSSAGEGGSPCGSWQAEEELSRRAGEKLEDCHNISSVGLLIGYRS